MRSLLLEGHECVDAVLFLLTCWGLLETPVLESLEFSKAGGAAWQWLSSDCSSGVCKEGEKSPQPAGLFMSQFSGRFGACLPLGSGRTLEG